MSKPPVAKLRELSKLQCWIFAKPYNPTNERIGSKVLTKALKGPRVVDYYYPPRSLIPTPKIINRKIDGWNCFDPQEEQRLARNEGLRKRGKGAPKKAKEKKAVDKKRR